MYHKKQRNYFIKKLAGTKNCFIFSTESNEYTIKWLWLIMSNYQRSISKILGSIVAPKTNNLKIYHRFLFNRICFATVHLVSIDGLVSNILNLVQTKDTYAITYMFGYVCSYGHDITWCCWRDIKMGHPTS